MVSRESASHWRTPVTDRYCDVVLKLALRKSTHTGKSYQRVISIEASTRQERKRSTIS